MTKPSIKRRNLLIAYILVVAIGFFSCGQATNATPSKYKLVVKVQPDQYAKDSGNLHNIVSRMLMTNTRPFTPAMYYTRVTRFYIDSILYSSNLERLIILVIREMPIDKKLSGGTMKAEYSGSYLFCERDPNESLKIFNYGPVSLDHYESYRDLKEALQELVFVRRAGDQWNEHENKFNMDDIRFWSSGEFNFISENEPYTQ